MARLVSSVLTVRGPAALPGRGACVCPGFSPVAGAEVARAMPICAAGPGCITPVAEAGAVGAAAATGPPGGRLGILMVGAEVGLGGKLMRTVSFLGCTLPVSFFGGSAPVGRLGIFSAIAVFCDKARIVMGRCQTQIGKRKNGL